MNSSLLLLFVLSLAALGCAKPLPSFVPMCYRDDPELDSCAVEALYAMKPRMIAGIPELFIPPMNPLNIPVINVEQGGQMRMKATFRNINITGLSDYNISHLHIDPESNRLVACVNFTELNLIGDYDIAGKIMMMPLVGQGECRMNVSNASLHADVRFEHVERDAQTHLRVKQMKLKHTLGNVQIALDNLFEGNKQLTDRMNEFMNKNWKLLSNDTAPLVQRAVVKLLRSSIDKLLEAYSYDELLPLK